LVRRNPSGHLLQFWHRYLSTDFGGISIQLTSIKGIHAVNLAVPILAEELEAVTAHQT